MGDKTYNSADLQRVKSDIIEKNNELLADIANATGIGDLARYNELKQLQLQCSAQLRFIELLENNFMTSNYIIC